MIELIKDFIIPVTLILIAWYIQYRGWAYKLGRFGWNDIIVIAIIVNVYSLLYLSIEPQLYDLENRVENVILQDKVYIDKLEELCVSSLDSLSVITNEMRQDQRDQISACLIIKSDYERIKSDYDRVCSKVPELC